MQGDGKGLAAADAARAYYGSRRFGAGTDHGCRFRRAAEVASGHVFHDRTGDWPA